MSNTPQPALDTPLAQAVSLLNGMSGLLTIHGNAPAGTMLNKAAATIRALQAERDRLRDDMRALHALDVTAREGQRAFAEWRNRDVLHRRAALAASGETQG